MREWRIIGARTEVANATCLTPLPDGHSKKEIVRIPYIRTHENLTVRGLFCATAPFLDLIKIYLRMHLLRRMPFNAVPLTVDPFLDGPDSMTGTQNRGTEFIFLII